MARKTLETVYVASYGWRYSDPIGGAWGKTPAQCERAVLRMAREEARYAWNNQDDQGESLASLQDQIAIYGPCSESVASLIENMEDRTREAELREDLASGRVAGYIY